MTLHGRSSTRGEGKKQAGPKVTLEHLQEVFGNGQRFLKRSLGVAELQRVAGVGRSAAYDALKADNWYGSLISERDDKTIGIQAQTE